MPPGAELLAKPQPDAEHIEITPSVLYVGAPVLARPFGVGRGNPLSPSAVSGKLALGREKGGCS